MQAEADALAKLCCMEGINRGYKNAFSEELDVVTLIHGDLWSSNILFKVTRALAEKSIALYACELKCAFACFENRMFEICIFFFK